MPYNPGLDRMFSLFYRFAELLLLLSLSMKLIFNDDDTRAMHAEEKIRSSESILLDLANTTKSKLEKPQIEKLVTSTKELENLERWYFAESEALRIRRQTSSFAPTRSSGVGTMMISFLCVIISGIIGTNLLFKFHPLLPIIWILILLMFLAYVYFWSQKIFKNAKLLKQLDYDYAAKYQQILEKWLKCLKN